MHWGREGGGSRRRLDLRVCVREREREWQLVETETREVTLANSSNCLGPELKNIKSLPPSQWQFISNEGLSLLHWIVDIELVFS